MAFDKMLEKLRRKKGLQVQALARQSGISQARLKMFERGTEKPTLTEVLALSYVLTTSPEELEYWENGSTTSTDKAQQVQNTPEGWDSAVQWSEPPKSEGNSRKKADAPKAKENQPEPKEAVQDVQTADETAKQQTAQAAPKAETAQKEDTSSQTATTSAPATAEKMHDAPKQPAKKPQKPTTTATAPKKTPTFTSNAGQDISTVDDPDGSLAQKMKDFGATLKQIREQKKIRYSTIQEQLGIEMIDYVRIERGKLIPRKDIFQKILKLFELQT